MLTTHNILGVDVKCIGWDLEVNSHRTVELEALEYYDEEELKGLDLTKDIYQLSLYYKPQPFSINDYKCLTANSIEALKEQLCEN